MKDKELRKLIGSRAKQRRLELGVNQPYIAEKMGVTASTISGMRQERLTTPRSLFWMVCRKHFMYQWSG